MKYFEYQNPFYALIAEESEEKANKIYSNDVCGDQYEEEKIDPAIYKPKELTEEEARKRYNSAPSADGDNSFDERIANFPNDAILLIDADLL